MRSTSAFSAIPRCSRWRARGEGRRRVAAEPRRRRDPRAEEFAGAHRGRPAGQDHRRMARRVEPAARAARARTRGLARRFGQVRVPDADRCDQRARERLGRRRVVVGAVRQHARVAARCATGDDRAGADAGAELRRRERAGRLRQARRPISCGASSPRASGSTAIRASTRTWAKRAKLEPDVAYRWLNNAKQRVGPVDETAAKDAQNTADFLYKAGVIPAAYDTSKLLDRSYAGAFAAPAQKTAAAQRHPGHDFQSSTQGHPDMPVDIIGMITATPARRSTYRAARPSSRLRAPLRAGARGRRLRPDPGRPFQQRGGRLHRRVVRGCRDRTYPHPARAPAGRDRAVGRRAQIATLDVFSGGRLALNVVSGGDDADLQRDGDFVPHDARYRRTGEYLDVLKRIWQADAPVDHDGAFYRLRGASPLVKRAAAARADLFRRFVAGCAGGRGRTCRCLHDVG